MRLEGKRLLDEIARLNLDPVNVAAGEVLPADWTSPDAMNVMALALWGLEQGLAHDKDLAGDAYYDMSQLPPRVALQMIVGSEDEPGLQPEDMEGEPLEDAAMWVLDQLEGLAS